MRIAFIGTVEGSRVCLDEVLRDGGHVVAVFTLPVEDAPRHADFADLTPLARQHGIPIHYVRNINSPESAALLAACRPDVLFVFGWSQLISPAILAIPPRGCIGLHPALLPEHRGRHPIIWALVEGLEKSGLTFFYLDEGADSGDILWQREFAITLEDTAATLYNTVCALAREGIRAFLPALARGDAPRRPQDHRRATYWRKRTAADGVIHWERPMRELYNLIRALTHPYVGANTYHAGEALLVWQAALPREPLPAAWAPTASGTVLRVAHGEFAVRTGDGYLTVTAYDRAFTPAVGIRLGDEP